MVAKPCDGALDDPALAITAQGTTVLGGGIGTTVRAVRRDHFDAEFGQGFVERIAVITFVPQ